MRTTAHSPAPELLDALKNAERLMVSGNIAAPLAIIRAAIARAEGGAE